MKTDLLKTEEAISLVKEVFEKELKQELQLTRVSSPIAILDGTGINDDLNGIERPVAFPVKGLNDKKAVIVQSLAKWKRLRLSQLGIKEGSGIVTDMRALRPDEEFSNIHSIYVDQWDWEKCINNKQRNLAYLKKTVREIYRALKATEYMVSSFYPKTEILLPEKITFIHSEDLLKQYPHLCPSEREKCITQKYGAVFIIGIGGKLSNGKAHDGRAPDYDDWSTLNEEGSTGLNGDILLWNHILGSAFELSSMGIRVNRESLLRQLEICSCTERRLLFFHQQLLSGKMPLSIGGGIGQSRLCMFLLRKLHIGEVQVGIWPEEISQVKATEKINFL